MQGMRGKEVPKTSCQWNSLSQRNLTPHQARRVWRTEGIERNKNGPKCSAIDILGRIQTTINHISAQYKRVLYQVLGCREMD